MGSKISITFTEEAVIDDYVSFNRRLISSPAVDFNMIEVFKAVRNNIGEVLVANPISSGGGSSAINFAQAFELDFNWGGFYNVTIESSGFYNNKVVIESVDQTYEFHSFDTNNNAITALIENVSLETFVVDEYTVDSSTDICNYYDLSITASELIKSLKVDGIISTIAPSSLTKSVGLIRGVSHSVSIINEGSVEVNVGTFNYGFLSVENIDINIVPSLAGATITVNVTNANNLILEHSLDNVNWTLDNVFTGQQNGSGFLYVRDQFGCVKSKAYEVTSLGTAEPYYYISKANSISYKLIQATDGYNEFDNEENTFEVNGHNKINYCDPQLFQTNDNPETQIKTNFNTVEAILRKDDGSEYELTPIKLSNNLGRFQSLDCIYYRYRAGKLAIYFEEGKTYDESGAYLSTFALNGDLPELAIRGQYINIPELGTHQIKSVIFDDNKKKRVILIDYYYEGADVISRCSSIYNLLPFEVWSFNTDFSIYGNGNYDVVITLMSDTYDDINYVSENIFVDTIHKNTLAIEYYNNNNRDLFYSYGIKNFIRVPYLRYKAKARNESSVIINDDNSSMNLSKSYEVDLIEFDDMLTYMFRKISIALFCEIIKINGVLYTNENSINSEDIDDTNIYRVNAELLKANVSYSTLEDNSSVDNGEFEDSTDIPSLVTTGTGFIKI